MTGEPKPEHVSVDSAHGDVRAVVIGGAQLLRSHFPLPSLSELQ